MQSDTIDRLRAVNPVPQDPPAPPIAPLLERIETELSSPPATRRLVGERGRALRRRRLALAALAGALIASLAGFAMLDGGSRQFSVAAAVFQAVTPGTGVRYIVEEEEAGSHKQLFHLYAQRWSTARPASERTLTRQVTRRGSVVVEAAITAGGTWSSWGSDNPDVIEHTRATGVRKDLSAELRAAYSSGRLRLLGSSQRKGRAVYRLGVSPPSRGAPEQALRSRREPENVVIVDAHSFFPVEDINYSHGPHGRLVPTFVIRFPVYEELPATAANLALVKMAAHAGAHVVQRP